MKIGIVVYSQTGHTLSVAERVQARLIAEGHSVGLERIETVGSAGPGTKVVKLQAMPDVGSYDALVFAGPVEGFNASPAMRACLMQLPALPGKRVACFVTESFPYPWMGGNSAISTMRSLCQQKQAAVAGTWVVNWSNRRREMQIASLVEGLAKTF